MPTRLIIECARSSWTASASRWSPPSLHSPGRCTCFPGRVASKAAVPCWKLALSGWLNIAALSPKALARSAQLMAKYADRPMDLADATLVALPEERGDRRIYTLDSDFEIYGLHGRLRFAIIPG